MASVGGRLLGNSCMACQIRAKDLEFVGSFPHALVIIILGAVDTKRVQTNNTSPCENLHFGSIRMFTSTAQRLTGMRRVASPCRPCAFW